jgi:regulatory protein
VRRRKSPEDLSPEQAEAQARETALRILGRREHSAEQLRRKLALRGHGEARADAVVDQLAAAGWQSDDRYAESLARSRAGQGYGPLRIRAELHAAGVGEEQIDTVIEALDVDFVDLARRTHARHFRGPAEGPAEHQKQYRYLAGRGFESEQIRAVLRGVEDD